VYDVNNEKSIEQIVMWRDECLSRHDSSEFFPIVVIGNKTDLRETYDVSKRVNQEPLLEWCRDNSYGHIETSAKDGFGVQAAIMAITALALDFSRTRPRHTDTPHGRDSVALNQPYERKSSGCC
jgi:GTPase SAR1 family protein